MKGVSAPMHNHRSQASSTALAAVACVALVGNGLLNCPPRFSQKHLDDPSLLRPVVTVLGLGARFPTARGVEIRNLIFFTAAAAMALIAGLRLLLAPPRPRLTLDALLDVRARAKRPFFWWAVLLATSAVSSLFSHAPETSTAAMVARFAWGAWWIPLAALLQPRHARVVLGGLVAALAATAGVGLWYHLVRVMPTMPDGRLQYPMGNELWLAACLLPGAFLCAGLAVKAVRTPDPVVGERSMDGVSDDSADDDSAAPPTNMLPPLRLFLATLAGLVILAGLYFTQSRSATIGFAAGAGALLLLMLPRRWRAGVALVLVLMAGAGVWTIQSWRAGGSTEQRAHSIRSRLNYEWPYAIRLFLERPFGGHGEGNYGLLAGQLARADQLEDPSILRMDEIRWTGRAHNEFLEMLADLGLFGTLGFAGALAVPVFWSVRTADALRKRRERTAERWLLICTTAAAVAGIIEMCGTPAIREPGLPPIFLTVWACLWVLARPAHAPTAPVASEAGPAESPTVESIETDAPKREASPSPAEPFAPWTARLIGAGVVAAAIALGGFGMLDWQAARARYEASAALVDRRFDEAIAKADFAADHAIDAIQRSLSTLLSIQARGAAFDAALAESNEPLPRDALERARQAMVRLNHLKRDAPRFLGASRLEAELYLNFARAAERSGLSTRASEYRALFVQALEASRADEPFLFDRVAALWQAKPASVRERIDWLRAFLRGGEMGPILPLVRQLLRAPGVDDVLRNIVRSAESAADRPPRQWPDELAPESLRLAAIIQTMRGHPVGGAELARKAEALYAAAGPRLFAGHAAAIHERAKYLFMADPTGSTEECLRLLAEAYAVAEGPIDPSTPLRDARGETRLNVLLAAGREDDAKRQIQVLIPDSTAPTDVQLAGAYLETAMPFIADGRFLAEAVRWCHRADQLAPADPQPAAMLVQALIKLGDDHAAALAADRFLKMTEESRAAIDYLRRLQAQLPDRPVWDELRRLHPEIEEALPAATAPSDDSSETPPSDADETANPPS